MTVPLNNPSEWTEKGRETNLSTENENWNVWWGKGRETETSGNVDNYTGENRDHSVKVLNKRIFKVNWGKRGVKWN